MSPGVARRRQGDRTVCSSCRPSSPLSLIPPSCACACGQCGEALAHALPATAEGNGWTVVVYPVRSRERYELALLAILRVRILALGIWPGTGADMMKSRKQMSYFRLLPAGWAVISMKDRPQRA